MPRPAAETARAGCTLGLVAGCPREDTPSGLSWRLCSLCAMFLTSITLWPGAAVPSSLPRLVFPSWTCPRLLTQPVLAGSQPRAITNQSHREPPRAFFRELRADLVVVSLGDTPGSGNGSRSCFSFTRKRPVFPEAAVVSSIPPSKVQEVQFSYFIKTFFYFYRHDAMIALFPETYPEEVHEHGTDVNSRRKVPEMRVCHRRSEPVRCPVQNP